jgi:hypothetical protein
MPKEWRAGWRLRDKIARRRRLQGADPRGKRGDSKTSVGACAKESTASWMAR